MKTSLFPCNLQNFAYNENFSIVLSTSMCEDHARLKRLSNSREPGLQKEVAVFNIVAINTDVRHPDI